MIEDEDHVGMVIGGVVMLRGINVPLMHQSGAIQSITSLDFVGDLFPSIHVYQDIGILGLLVDLLHNLGQLLIPVGRDQSDVIDGIETGILFIGRGNDGNSRSLQTFHNAISHRIEGCHDFVLPSRFQSLIGLQSIGEDIHEVIGCHHGSSGTITHLIHNAEADILQHGEDALMGGILEPKSLQNTPAIFGGMGRVTIINDGGAGIGTQCLLHRSGCNMRHCSNGSIELVPIDEIHSHSNFFFELYGIKFIHLGSLLPVYEWTFR